MCRLAAFPPGFQRHHAINILSRFAKGNSDGTGSVHVKDGDFVVNKWPLPLFKCVDKPLLDHMPHNGWTVVHLRAASHGPVAKENTHPFVQGPWGVVHNGIWSDYDLVKAALRKYVKFQGETDSEVASVLLANIGPKRFSKLITFAGVFLALNKNGDLWTVKTSGDLEMIQTKYGMLLASTLPERFQAPEQSVGWMRFNPNGKLAEKKEYEYSYKNYSHSSGYGPMCGFGRGGRQVSHSADDEDDAVVESAHSASKEEETKRLGHAW